MQTEGERISSIISHFCKTKAEFAKIMEVSPQVVSNWVSRGAGKNVLNKILLKFPDINANWLLQGDGKILKEDYYIDETNKSPIPYEFVQALIEERKRHDEERKRHDEMNAELIRQNGSLIRLLEEKEKSVVHTEAASNAVKSMSGLQE